MGMVHYIKPNARRALLRGQVPAWIGNSPRKRYITQVVLSSPPWLDRHEMFMLHRWAKVMTVFTGVQHVMDHVIPLNHPAVCGLTVPWNLRVIAARPNMSKGNKWCPDQLELF